MGVEAADGGFEPVGQADLAVGVALGAGDPRVGRGDVGTVSGLPAQCREPLQRGLFEVVFAEDAHGGAGGLGWRR